MTPHLIKRFLLLSAANQEQILPMIEDLITVVEQEGAALLLADPLKNGCAAMLAVGDVHFVCQLLMSGAQAYGELYERTLQQGVMQ
jgi:hypothetical protein